MVIVSLTSTVHDTCKLNDTLPVSGHSHFTFSLKVGYSYHVPGQIKKEQIDEKENLEIKVSLHFSW